MQLAIIHYHLNRGGVTRVIENHLRGLSFLDDELRPTQALLLYGGRDDGWNDIADLSFPLSRIKIPELDYDEISNCDSISQEHTDGTQLSARIEQALENAYCDRSSTLIHVHNHCLGKNQQLPPAVGKLAASGWRLLLQPHDFAEDFRPANYQHMHSGARSREDLQCTLYPQGQHVHYATLNRRDLNVLQRAQFPAKRIHLLPNSVSTSVEKIDRAEARNKLIELGVPVDRPYILYPVRAIRRKNLGEFLLWAAMFPRATFAVTLAPLNPHEEEAYRFWVALAESLKLDILFNVGARMSLAENYAAADAAITTSVAEGFGLVFLEATLANLPLFGRNLPGITDDFRQAGMEFPGLSTAVQIPVGRLDRDHVIRRHSELYEQLVEAYGMQTDSEEGGREGHGFDEVSFDFGRLDRHSQQAVISQVSQDQALRSELLELNPCFQAMGAWLTAGQAHDLSSNRDIIQRTYSLGVLGKYYRRICREVLESSVEVPTLDPRFGQSILEQFLRPGRLFPVRFE